MQNLFQDIRYSFRMMLKAPGFTALVILSLALGIGANTAIFSAIDALMLRLLPVRNPRELVLLQWTSKTSQMQDEYLNDLEGEFIQDEGRGINISFSFSYPAYQAFSRQNHAFSETFAFAANGNKVNVGLDGRAESANLQGVSGNYFPSMGVPAVVGRTLLPSDDTASAQPAAVVSHQFFQQKLGGDVSAIGRSVVIDGLPVTVVGVVAPEFFGLEPGSSPDFWVPLNSYAAQWTRENGTSEDPVSPLTDQKNWWVGIVGRLKPGVTSSQAQAELAVLFNQSLDYAGKSMQPALQTPEKRLGFELVPVKNGLDSLRRQFSTSLRLLMAMVGLVLLIACANVGGLLLAKFTARQGEIGIRLSLGAPRSRILRQVLTESLMLALLGGAAGLLVANWMSSALMALLSSGRNPVYLTLQTDGRVLGFTVLISMISGILFGSAPALYATRVDPLVTLKQNSATLSRGRKKFSSGRLLVIGQVAMSLCMLIAAGLFVRTLVRLQNVPLGFDQRNLVVFTVQPGLNGYTDARLSTYYEELQRRIEAVPGVRSVSFAERGPVGSGSWISTGRIPGYSPQGKDIYMWRHDVSAGYFDTLGIPLVSGRGIGPQDTPGAPKVAVINQTLAKKYFHDENPIGHRVSMGDEKHLRDFEIVGVAKDVKYAQIRDDAPPTIYFSHLQRSTMLNFMTFEVRTSGDPAGFMDAIRTAAVGLDKDIPVINLRAETEVVDQVFFLERTFAMLSSSFGFLALVLACVGLYGTMAYTVVQRTKEIGIRLALGAERVKIQQMVLGETLLIVACGLAVGFPLAYLGARLLQSQIFELSPHDPITILFSTAAILTATAAAGYIPAWRASRVDPMVALHYE